MIPSKLWGYAGIAAFIMALAAVIIWQANSLMHKGIELGQAKAVEKGLREEVQHLRNQRAEEVKLLKEELASCTDQWAAAEEAGNEYRAKWDEIRRRPPIVRTVEVEATTWKESLVEGHEKFLSRLEGVRNANDSYPPG